MRKLADTRCSVLHMQIEVITQPSRHLHPILSLVTIRIRIAASNVEHFNWITVTVDLILVEILAHEGGLVPDTIVVASVEERALDQLLLPSDVLSELLEGRDFFGYVTYLD